MPRLSIWFVRAALLHLALGALLGGLIMCAKGFPGSFGWAWRLLQAHIQIMVVGWMAQLAIGVAYWIMPRLAGNRRGRDAWAVSSFVMLNAGVVAASVLLALRAFDAPQNLAAPIVASGLLQALGLAAFAIHAWPRARQVVPSPPQAAPGKRPA